MMLKTRANALNTIHTSSFKQTLLWSIYSRVHIFHISFDGERDGEEGKQRKTKHIHITHIYEIKEQRTKKKDTYRVQTECMCVCKQVSNVEK